MFAAKSFVGFSSNSSRVLLLIFFYNSLLLCCHNQVYSISDIPYWNTRVACNQNKFILYFTVCNKGQGIRTLIVNSCP